jgi:hypothetical protein
MHQNYFLNQNICKIKINNKFNYKNKKCQYKQIINYKDNIIIYNINHNQNNKFKLVLIFPLLQPVSLLEIKVNHHIKCQNIKQQYIQISYKMKMKIKYRINKYRIFKIHFKKQEWDNKIHLILTHILIIEQIHIYMKINNNNKINNKIMKYTQTNKTNNNNKIHINIIKIHLHKISLQI